ncbi:MAG: beta strand repeat-containing protein, partial [Actinomycetota bacterium]
TVASGAALHISGASLSIAEPFTISGTGITSTGAIRNLNSAGTDNNTITGLVTLGAAASVGSDADTLTFDVSGTGTVFGAGEGTSFGLTVVGAGGVTVSDAIATPITTLTKGSSSSDTGTLTLSATNTYTGATSVAYGTLKITTAGALSDSTATTSVTAGTLEIATLSTGSEPLTIAGTGVSSAGAVYFSAAGTLSGTVALSTGGATIQVASTVTGTASGVVSGSTTLTKTCDGTLDLQATNTHSGGLTISAGTVSVSSTGSLNSGTYAGAISNAGTFSYASSTDQTLTGELSGAGTFAKSGASTLTLDGASDNTYTGATTVSAGVLKVKRSVALGTTAGNTQVSGTGAVHFDGASGLTVAEPFSLSGDGSGSGALLNVANSNSVTRLVTLSGATTVGSTSGTLTFDVSSGSAFGGTNTNLTVAGAG